MFGERLFIAAVFLFEKDFAQVHSLFERTVGL